MKFLFSLLAGVSFGICPNDDWTVEAGNVKCSPRDLLVTCNKSGLSIKVTNKHVYTNMPASMASNAKVEIGTCDNKFTVSTGEDGKLDGYTATINFDECGVLLQQPSSETISYSWKVKGTLASAKIGVITVTEPLEFQVSCNFDATISLKSSETSVASMDTELTDISSDTSDSFSTSLSLGLFTSNSYDAPLSNIDIGGRVYAKITSTLPANIIHQITKCTSYESEDKTGLHYDIINGNGCVSTILDATIDKDASTFAFDAFSFAGASSDKVWFVCEVQLCAKESEGTETILDGCFKDSLPTEGYECQSRAGSKKWIVLADEYNMPRTSYVLGADDSVLQTSSITTPSFGYLSNPAHVIYQDHLFIFGGNANPKRVAKLVGCAFQTLLVTLKHDILNYQNGVAVLPGTTSKVFLCFVGSNNNDCEVFDGSQTTIYARQTGYDHSYGRLATYDEKLIAISGSGDGKKKVEILEETGWTEVNDHPRSIAGFTALTINDHVLTLGGYEYGIGNINDIYVFKGLQWSLVGALNTAQTDGTAVYFDNSIVYFSGSESPFNVERIQWGGSSIGTQSVIHSHDTRLTYPIVMDAALTSCTLT